VITENKIDIRE